MLFVTDFGGPAPPSPPHRLRCRGSPLLCLAAFGHKTELTPCVYQHFWVSGFPVPMRERLPEGNLPLSEDVSEEYPERQPEMEHHTPTRAGGTVADITGRRLILK